MADYSVALGVRPPQIDIGGAMQLAGSLQNNQLQQQNMLHGQRIAEERLKMAKDQQAMVQAAAAERLAAERGQRNALSEYNQANAAGDENALSKLSSYPDLQSKILGVRSQMDEAQRAKFDRGLINNARRAQYVAGLQGEQKSQAWFDVLAEARDAGDITPEMHQQYASQQPNDLLLHNVISQAVPIQQLYQQPTAKMQELEAAGLEPGTEEYRAAILPSAFSDQPAAVKEYALAKREGFAGNFTEFLKEKKGPLVTIQGEKSYEETRGKALAEDFGTLQGHAQQATDRIGQLQQIDNLLSNPNVYTGTGAQAINALKRTAQTLFGQDSIEGVADADAARRISTEMALSLKENLPGPMSDSDREFLQGIPPSIGDTAQGRKLLVELMTAKEQRKIEAAELAREYAAQNNGRLDDGWYTALARYNAQNPVFSTEQMERARTVAGAGEQQSPAAGVLPRVNDVKSYNAIPRGNRYIDPEGRIRTKN